MSDAEGRTDDRRVGAPAPPPRRLTRSRRDRVCCGVAGGLARYLGVDAVLVRLGFVVATFLAGIGLVAYIAGWLLIPEEADGGGPRTRPDVRGIVGFAVLGVGLLVVLGHFDLWIDERTMWAVGLIAIGGAVLWVRGRDARASELADPGDPTPAAVPAAAPPGPPEAVPSGAPPWPPPPAPAAPPPPAAPTPGAPAPRPRRSLSLLGPLTLCALAVWGGVAAGLHAGGRVDVGAGFVIAGALIVIGAALVVGARWGRARWLVVPGIALALLFAAWSAVDLPLAGGIGERNHRPASFAVVEDQYELGLGSLRLDLRDLDFRGRDEALRVTVGVGETNVWVPDGVRVVVDGRVGFGELQVFGGQHAGAGVDERVVRAGTEGGGTLRLELRGGIGSVKVLDADDGGPR